MKKKLVLIPLILIILLMFTGCSNLEVYQHYTYNDTNYNIGNKAYNEEINDSKKISEKKREKLFDTIMNDAIGVGIGVSSEKVIDKILTYCSNHEHLSHNPNNFV